MRRLSLTGMILIAVCSLGACSLFDQASPATEVPLPTLASLDTLPTAIFLTENAPPTGFGQVDFDPIDARLPDRPGWAYTAVGEFTGTFDDTGGPAAGTFDLRVQANELGQARRVVLVVEGAAFAPDDMPRRLEGVRISNDYYLVDNNGFCTAGGQGAIVIADLSAGQVIGGVMTATPTGHRQEIGGVPTWQYTFAPDAVRLPALRREPGSVVNVDADLWIAPDLNAVLRFELTLTVARVRILSAERPVSGTLYLHYELDLAELDALPNISIPHGC